jgi:hypothetical protein
LPQPCPAGGGGDSRNWPRTKLNNVPKEGALRPLFAFRSHFPLPFEKECDIMATINMFVEK